MSEFNKGDSPIVYGTIQCYLRDAKERMVQAVEAADREGFLIGLKLVRGAYLTRETELANSLGVASPIHPSIQETHACYDDCASFMLERIVKGSASLVLATHNLESGKSAKAEELGVGKVSTQPPVLSADGMADGLSWGSGNAGFQVSASTCLMALLTKSSLIFFDERRRIRACSLPPPSTATSSGIASLPCCKLQLKEIMRRMNAGVLGKI
ncbi:uncharacterized protein A4U43_C04F9530 [Asparagus officinalis]|uniref:Proline dehydrogenase n=1 Tax=Asparagus officinalis TaxID=4686 RepID=A0A5P1F087_ASPOF|nr:uncharacterized protein A4U43_C04F9530 [Asparagus officinalis]